MAAPWPLGESLPGIEMEIEVAGAASKLRQQHPDWILTRNGLPIANGRHLDVGNPAVAKWMESEIARIIRKYDLDVFRIDYNMSTEEDGNQVRDGFVEEGRRYLLPAIAHSGSGFAGGVNRYRGIRKLPGLGTLAVWGSMVRAGFGPVPLALGTFKA
jgi:hypothetical protein